MPKEIIIQEMFVDIFAKIAEVSNNNLNRKKEMIIRSGVIKPGMVKVAFDTRKIDQYNDYNPRRGLQHFKRQEPFVSTETREKINSLKVVQAILETAKEKYISDDNWLDSNSRILLDTVNRVLRKNIDDDNYSETQNSLSSIAYVEELLNIRYGINISDISEYNKEKIAEALLKHDPSLTKNGFEPLVFNNKPVNIKNYDNLANEYNMIKTQLFDLKNSMKTNGNEIKHPTQMPMSDNLAKYLTLNDDLVKKLMNNNSGINFNITNGGGSSDSTSNILKELFGVKATEGKDAERTITITIKDKYVPTSSE